MSWLSLRGGVVAVVDRRIAQEVKVGGDRKPEIDLPARIAADHTGLYVVQLLRAGRTVFSRALYCRLRGL